jgi:hypothetical protein
MLRTYNLSSLGYVSLVSSLARAGGCATIGNWQSETSCRDPSHDMKRRVEWARPPEDYLILFHLSSDCIAYCSVAIQSLTTEVLYPQLPLLGTYFHPADGTEHGPDSALQPALL